MRQSESVLQSGRSQKSQIKQTVFIIPTVLAINTSKGAGRDLVRGNGG